jgi:hypothetical protein
MDSSVELVHLGFLYWILGMTTLEAGKHTSGGLSTFAAGRRFLGCHNGAIGDISGHMKEHRLFCLAADA